MGVRVRLPSAAPRRRGRHIVRGDFFQKSPLTHFVAAPFQIEPASLGFDLVLGANLKVVTSKLGACTTPEQSSLCSGIFLQKCHQPPLLLPSNRDPLTRKGYAASVRRQSRQRLRWARGWSAIGRECKNCVQYNSLSEYSRFWIFTA